MQYYGIIEFADSDTRESRETLITNFSTISDWWQSVREYFRQEVMNGHYDGSAIAICVFQQETETTISTCIEKVVINNPYYK